MIQVVLAIAFVESVWKVMGSEKNATVLQSVHFANIQDVPWKIQGHWLPRLFLHAYRLWGTWFLEMHSYISFSLRGDPFGLPAVEEVPSHNSVEKCGEVNNSCRHCFWPSVSDIAVWSVVKTRTVGWNGSMCSQLKRRGSAVLLRFILLLFIIFHIVYISMHFVLIKSTYSTIYVCFCILMPHPSFYDIATARSLWEFLSMAVCIPGLQSTCLGHDIVRIVCFILPISLNTATFCYLCRLDAVWGFWSSLHTLRKHCSLASLRSAAVIQQYIYRSSQSVESGRTQLLV